MAFGRWLRLECDVLGDRRSQQEIATSASHWLQRILRARFGLHRSIVTLCVGAALARGSPGTSSTVARQHRDRSKLRPGHIRSAHEPGSHRARDGLRVCHGSGRRLFPAIRGRYLAVAAYFNGGEVLPGGSTARKRRHRESSRPGSAHFPVHRTPEVVRIVVHGSHQEAAGPTRRVAKYGTGSMTVAPVCRAMRSSLASIGPRAASIADLAANGCRSGMPAAGGFAGSSRVGRG